MTEKNFIPSRSKRLFYKGLFRLFPNLYWQSYKQKSLDLGLDRLYLILSFDCDTSEDIVAAEQIHNWMLERGLKATYAVPGKQLLEGKEAYRQIADSGGDFINHGARPHTEWRDSRYYSITFYNQLPVEEVIDDIRRGHEMIGEVIGQPPVGFRAPHFGHFQKPSQLALLYSVLGDLDYQYATTTVPWFAREFGPARHTDDMWEFPLSGSYKSPLRILDSWGYLESYGQVRVSERYSQLFIATIDALVSTDIPGILNMYVDPAHVYKNEGFFNAIEHTVAKNVPMLQYADLLELLKQQ
ncbi:MAG: hypothetical protein DWQ07_09025 [Chloroflexi bacterium]|nr:MAG: hypothetical protein DWQ07_09025 [Chloroflexota bacterium]MBL1193145.1 hypothetical protein [Chloroflexota bacterium]NOH10438.1 polysaccharide deacetylase family protein [Chloroflexota bacterium]